MDTFPMDFRDVAELEYRRLKDKGISDEIAAEIAALRTQVRAQYVVNTQILQFLKQIADRCEINRDAIVKLAEVMESPKRFSLRSFLGGGDQS